MIHPELTNWIRDIRGWEHQFSIQWPQSTSCGTISSESCPTCKAVAKPSFQTTNMSYVVQCNLVNISWDRTAWSQLYKRDIRSLLHPESRFPTSKVLKRFCGCCCCSWHFLRVMSNFLCTCYEFPEQWTMCSIFCSFLIFSTNMHTICHVLAMWVLDTDILWALFLSRTGNFSSG